MNYDDFILAKASSDVESGFEPSNLGDHLFDFQSSIVDWACKRGRAAIFADTGLGKTAMQTEWARQVSEHTNGRVLIAAPLCVAQQTVEEAAKFGIHVQYCRHAKDIHENAQIIITNYEMLHNFDADDFVGVVMDESSILKDQMGRTRTMIIEMFRGTPYKLSCTATPSPNDHMELGNQAEFLGVMTAVEMLAMFFVHDGGDTAQWRLKGHGKTRFWEWMATWSICIRNPSDLGFDGSRYNLPGLQMHEHVVDSLVTLEGELFEKQAQTLTERRNAKRASMADRIQIVGSIVSLGISDKLAASTTNGLDYVEARICSETKGEISLGRVREIKEVVSGEQDSRRKFGVHEGLCESESREVQADSIAATESERRQEGKVCSRPGVSRENKNNIQAAPCRQPGSKASAAFEKVRTDNGMLRQDDGICAVQMPDLRTLRAEAQDVPDDRPLPRNNEGQGDSLLELQYGSREVQGQSGSSRVCNSVPKEKPWLIWCHLNDEQDALEKLFGSRAFSVRGSMPPDKKEEATLGWLRGDRPIMISKTSILGAGLNFQHCSDMVFAGLDDSYESFYQAIRRCHRFGQTKSVHVHIVSSKAEGAVKSNLERKQAQADDMAQSMVVHMQALTKQKLVASAMRDDVKYTPNNIFTIPSWIQTERLAA